MSFAAPEYQTEAQLRSVRTDALSFCRSASRSKKGLDYVVGQLHPDTIVVYGKAPDSIFERYRESGISVKQFESGFAIAHRKAVSE